MTDSQVPRTKMGIYSYFNIITQHFGQDNLSHAIPVPEQEEKHAYELPMRSHEEKAKLEKTGNKILQLILINIQSLFSMVTKRSCTIGAVVTNYGPYTHQGNAGNKKQKVRDSRETLASQAVQGGNQLKE